MTIFENSKKEKSENLLSLKLTTGYKTTKVEHNFPNTRIRVEYLALTTKENKLQKKWRHQDFNLLPFS